MTIDDLAAGLLDVSLSNDPIGASLIGVPGYDGLLPDLSVSAEEETSRKLGTIAQRADNLAGEALDEDARQTLDFVRYTATGLRDAARVPLAEWTIGDFFAAPVAGVLTLLPKVAIDSDQRAAGYLERLKTMPEFLTAATQRHREGIANARSPVAHLVRAAIAQLDLLLSDPVIGGLKRQRPQDQVFNEEMERLAEDLVRPALGTYSHVLRSEMVDASRDDEHCGLCWLPDGPEMYEALARRHTSTTLSAQQLHALGLDLIDDVTSEFSEVGAGLWGTSAVGEIFDRLRNDRALRYTSADEMLGVARRAVSRAEAAAPRWFGMVPEERCLVEAVAESEEAGAAPAYYIQGALDGSRQGTYFLNTSKPHERFRHLAEVVAFHEAVPGHHFQLTIALHRRELPLARRIMMDTACAEGWGLYTERLADEMSLYSDDLSRLGMLSAEAWRAGRLVVDTGIHDLGWGRQQAVDWMHEHTPLASLEIESEIDRYITYPGQALSYMVGRIELRRLRDSCATRLGARFDLRAFHDLILRVGALPLSALAGAVDRWSGSLAGEPRSL